MHKLILLSATSIITFATVSYHLKQQHHNTKDLLEVTENRISYNYIAGVDGDITTVEFKLHNKSNQPTSISGIEKSCNCYQVDYTKGEIPPLGYTPIKIQMGPLKSKEPARQSAKVGVSFSNGTKSELHANGMAYPSWGWSAQSLRLGEINIGETINKEIAVYAYSYSELSPTAEVYSDSRECTILEPHVRMEIIDKLGPVMVHKGVVKLQLKTESARSHGSAGITITSNHPSHNHPERLQVEWSTENGVKITPRLLIIRNANRNKSASSRITISGLTTKAHHPKVTIINPISSDVRIEQSPSETKGSIVISMHPNKEEFPEILHGEATVLVEGEPHPLIVPFVLIP